MRILFITNLLPYPLDNGGKIKSYNTLKMLSKENIIDIFSFYEDDREKESLEYMRKQFNEVNIIKKHLTTSTNIKKMILIGVKSLLSKSPFVILKYKDNKMKSLLKEKINENKYDLIYIDHLQLGVYFDILKKANCPIYLDQHNCESQILKRKIVSKKSICRKIFLTMEFLKLKKFENKIISEVDKVIVLSEEDKNILINNLEEKKEKINKNKFITIPIPIDNDYIKPIGISKGSYINLLFLGTLSWYPNENGIKWFIINVISKLEQKNIKYKLYIVGKNPDDELINLCKDYKNIIITGYVEDINDYIGICDLMIVPIFIGSGMRVKILEGLGKRIPIISTNIGAEGINVNHEHNIFIANSVDEYVDGIIKLSDNKLYSKLQENGLSLFEEHYSLESIIKKYRKYVLNMS